MEVGDEKKFWLYSTCKSSRQSDTKIISLAILYLIKKWNFFGGKSVDTLMYNNS